MLDSSILQELLQQKRTYEALLALNAANGHSSPVLEDMLRVRLLRVVRSLRNLQQQPRT